MIGYYRGHVELKQEWVQYLLRRTQLKKIEYRSLIVFGVPRNLRHEIDLAAYFEGLGIGSVENVVICRTWGKLRNAVAKRFYFLQQLERIYHECMNRGKRRRKLYNGPRVRLSSNHSHNHINNTPINDYNSQRSAFEDQVSTSSTNPQQATVSTASSSSISSLQNSLSSSPLNASDLSNVQLHQETSETSLYEIMTFLDAIDPRYRPAHRTGLFGIFGELVDSADYYAEEYKKWDQLVTQLRRTPEKSAATSVAFVTFESPESAVSTNIYLHSLNPAHLLYYE